MRILVLAQEAVDAARVRSALPGDDLSDAEVLVVVLFEVWFFFFSGSSLPKQ